MIREWWACVLPKEFWTYGPASKGGHHVLQSFILHSQNVITWNQSASLLGYDLLVLMLSEFEYHISSSRGLGTYFLQRSLTPASKQGRPQIGTGLKLGLASNWDWPVLIIFCRTYVHLMML